MKKQFLKGALIGTMLIGGLFVLTGCGDEKQNSNDSSSNNNANIATSIVDLRGITYENYGDNFSYSVNVNGKEISNWKVFLKDAEGIYIITSDYIDSTILGDSSNANSIAAKTGMKVGSSLYGMDIEWENSPETLQNTNDNIMNKYHSSYKLNTEKQVCFRIATLLNSDNWSEFVNDKYGASYAIGTPTVEMFCKSWNSKYTNEKITYTTNENGYKCEPVKLKDYAGYNDTLYFPRHEEESWYHLASQEAGDGDSAYGNLMRITARGNFSSDMGYRISLRPVVFIPFSN